MRKAAHDGFFFLSPSSQVFQTFVIVSTFNRRRPKNTSKTVTFTTITFCVFFGCKNLELPPSLRGWSCGFQERPPFINRTHPPYFQFHCICLIASARHGERREDAPRRQAEARLMALPPGRLRQRQLPLPRPGSLLPTVDQRFSLVYPPFSPLSPQFLFASSHLFPISTSTLLLMGWEGMLMMMTLKSETNVMANHRLPIHIPPCKQIPNFYHFNSLSLSFHPRFTFGISFSTLFLAVGIQLRQIFLPLRSANFLPSIPSQDSLSYQRTDRKTDTRPFCKPPFLSQHPSYALKV